jgi:exodeoxyribonuclease V alpha subunit
LRAATDTTTSRETLVGSVERVTFHNEENGFAVLKVKARGKRDLVTVVGHAASISAGEFIHAVGVSATDRTHGLQFKADLLKTTPPTTSEGIEKYLGSGMVRGIGPKLPKRIVDAFGTGTFELIEATPEKLRDVSGIGEFRAGKIAAGWAEQKAVRDIMVFLHSHGVGTSHAVRIFKTYGHDAIQVMTEDPYRLARDIRGIGFRTADAMAMKMGMTREAPQRLRAGVSFALQEATDDGHCGLPVDNLVTLATKLLDVDKTLVRSALDHELAGAEVVGDTIGAEACVFLRGLHIAERGVAERLRSLVRGALPWPGIDVEKALPWVEKKTGKLLAASQRAAIDMALRSKVTVITGGPGVGKTTLLDAILRILAAKGTKILLAAPTGRAAKRMTEQTGLEAKTIHRLLEIDPKSGGFRRGADNPLDCDLLVVDETSMVDISLMFSLVKAVPARSALLLVGDVDQLPSVGPGQVLGDIINSGAIPVARLTEVFARPPRVGSSSTRTGSIAGKCRNGQSAARIRIFGLSKPSIPRRERRRSWRLSATGFHAALASTRFATFKFSARCSAARSARGRSTPICKKPSIRIHPRRSRNSGRFSRPATRSCRPKTITDVFNGDLGTVLRIDEVEGLLVAGFDGREVEYPFGELDTVVPAYATTIHKSQGSEYPAVVITLATQHYTMLARNLVYTAVTRGKRLVVIVGQRRAMAIAVRSGGGRKRWTKLREWLAAK